MMVCEECDGVLCDNIISLSPFLSLSLPHSLYQDDCVATFTTDPQRIKLHLPEILDAFPDSFPLDAMMFAPEGDADDFPPHLTTDMVTLTHTSILSSIIATTHWDDDGN